MYILHILFRHLIFIDSFDLAKKPDIKHFLSLRLSLEIHEKFELDKDFLEDFTQLKKQLPDLQQEPNYIINWWKTQGEEWIYQFRNLLIYYRKIGYNWQLNEQEKELLNHFYEGNSFLVECLQGQGNISPKVKQEIESNLLLI